MPGVTEWVRRALAELGPEAPDQAVKAYIGERDSTVPLGQCLASLTQATREGASLPKKTGSR
jgi:hypothetical protein